MLIFEQMDQFAKFAIVCTVSCGVREVRSCFHANGANLNGRWSGYPRQIFATNLACRPADWTHARDALRTHRQARNIFQRGAANTAIGGKKGREQALGDRGRTRIRKIHQASPCGVPGAPEFGVRDWGNGRANCVSGTAEDRPPSPGARLGSSRTILVQYS